MENRLITKRGKEFRDAQIASANIFLPSSISLDELPIGTANPVVDFSLEMPTLFRPADAEAMATSDGKLLTVRPYGKIITADTSDFAYGEEMWVYKGDTLVALLFQKNLEYLRNDLYQINCVTFEGLLENEDHYGGLYNGESFGDILESVMGGIVPYTIDEGLRDIAVYGHLPLQRRRQNLHTLIFAEGVSIKMGPNGYPHFAGLQNEAPIYTSKDQIYVGGKVTLTSPATRVSVTEHAYAAYDTDPEQVLFEGESAVAEVKNGAGEIVLGNMVTFSQPMHDLQITNGSIIESGVNYAILSAAADCLLTGKAYTHTTRIVSRERSQAARAAQVEVTENEVSVKGNTLVSLVNSENVADRLMAFYGSAQFINTDTKVNSSRPGDAVDLDYYPDHAVRAFLETLDITLSGVLRSASTFVTGFIPTTPGNNYKHWVLLTGTGTFTVPEEAGKNGRVVLMSGGPGGWSGYKGHPAEYNGAHPTRYGNPGDGGDPGEGGPGALVAVYTIHVEPGQEFAYACGQGGDGGVMNADGTSGPGQPGGTTTFGTLTSDGGVHMSGGYINMMSGQVYALPGTPGVPGGRGQEANGVRPTLTYKGSVYTAGKTGQSATEEYEGGTLVGGGGRGGGAAAGRDGDNGGNGYWYPRVMNGGGGGNGVTGVPGEDADQTEIGRGGGGNGGGGGGSGGAVSGDDSHTWAGGQGMGGGGSQGGKGSPGGILFFY